MIVVRASDKRIACDEEFSESEDEDGGPKDSNRKDKHSFKPKTKRLRTEEDKKEGGGDKGIMLQKKE